MHDMAAIRIDAPNACLAAIAARSLEITAHRTACEPGMRVATTTPGSHKRRVSGHRVIKIAAITGVSQGS
jgi:hypothetical protein